MAGRETASATQPAVRAEQLVDLIAAAGRITDLPIARRRWFVPVDGALPTGTPAPDGIRIPQADANRLMRGFVRFVADIDAGTNLELVWERGRDELWVDAGSIKLTCAAGILSTRLSVGCDELPRPVTVTVPFAVGRPDAPRGLLMATTDRVDAPTLVADGWSSAITAFCWEAILELARRVSAESGNDQQGRPLVPGAVSADDRVLVVHPMARHDLSGLERHR
jgi:hypothetical protein